jgi:integrase
LCARDRRRGDLQVRAPLGGILTYAVEGGIIESNPAHGIRKPKDNVRKRRLSEAEYRILGRMLRDAAEQEKYNTIVDIIRHIALTGSRRSEMIGLKWTEADTEVSCLRLEDSKEGESIRPIGLPVVEYLERRRTGDVGTYVFPGQGEDNAFGSFLNHWKHLFEDSPLSDVTPHVLRHSFASIANDLGLTEVTIAALVGHAKGSSTALNSSKPPTRWTAIREKQPWPVSGRGLRAAIQRSSKRSAAWLPSWVRVTD